MTDRYGQSRASVVAIALAPPLGTPRARTNSDNCRANLQANILGACRMASLWSVNALNLQGSYACEPSLSLCTLLSAGLYCIFLVPFAMSFGLGSQLWDFGDMLGLVALAEKVYLSDNSSFIKVV